MGHRVINIFFIRQRHFLKQQTIDQFKNHTQTHIYVYYICIFINVARSKKVLKGKTKQDRGGPRRGLSEAIANLTVPPKQPSTWTWGPSAGHWRIYSDAYLGPPRGKGASLSGAETLE